MVEEISLRDIFNFIAYWIVIPVILIGLFFLGRSIINSVALKENKTSAKAGFWGGLVLFVIYFLFEIPLFKTPQFVKIESLRLNIPGVLIGGLFGFFILFILKYVIPTRVVGFVVLFLTFSSTAALYSYIFIQTFNDWLLSSTLGVAFGALLHITVWPRSVQDIFVKPGSDTASKNVTP